MQLDVLERESESHRHTPLEAHAHDMTGDPEALAAHLKRHVRGEVRFDLGSRALYAQDGSNYRHVPIGVVIPKSVEDVIATMDLCHQYGAPITARGAGSSLCGQTCNVAVIIDFSKYMNRILEVNPHAKTARVEPGVILDHFLKRTEKHHLTMGPDPSTHEFCTLGGMIGNNSCGVHSIMSGRTSDCVESLDVLTYDGLRLRVGATSEDQLQELANKPGRIGEIYRGMRELRDEYAQRIRDRYPDIPRRVSGYNLDELLPENGFNVARALVGTEGTCVTVLNATVKLVHSPPVRSLLVLGYKDVYESGDHISEIMECGPVGLEGMDELLVDLMKKQGIHPKDLKILPEGGGWLLAEFGGETKEEADDKAQECMEKIKKQSNPPSMKLVDDPAQEKQIWTVRKSGLGATAKVPGMGDTWPGWEDAAVNPNRIGDYLREFRTLLDKHKLFASLYGHFGQGCVHCRIGFNLKSEEGIKNFRAFLDEASDLVVKYDGSFSAEHGDGQSKAIFLPKMYGKDLVDAMRRFKLLWDPKWKMNPGKVIDPHGPTEDLRLGADYHPWEPKTFFRYGADKGKFSEASLRCVGVGKCRRTDNAFMCPSFQATRDEKDTTRGRARMLFEMVKAEEISDGWKSKEVLDSLDLCLGCKGCVTDCPVSVDMATYKSEFLAHHYQGRLHPRAAYAMGLIGWWAPLGATMPGLMNFVTSVPPLSNLAKSIAGISQHRPIPPFAAQPFTQWFANRQTPAADSSAKTILLYPDAFNNYFYPQTLKSAVKVMERMGYRVTLPHGSIPCIRPLLHYGFLKAARRQMKSAVRLLEESARQGTPIIALEPSTVSVFRDELTALLGENDTIKKIKKQVVLLSEFLHKEQIHLPRLKRQAILHGHCHQKAVLDMGSMRKLLEQMGVEVQEPEKSCCGMAGSFGLEAEHFDISQKIGKANLIPAVEQADKRTLVIADGFSCRTQVLDMTDRHPMHFAEVLELAYDQAPEKDYPERDYVSEDYPRATGTAVALGAAGVTAVAAGAYWWWRKSRRD